MTPVGGPFQLYHGLLRKNIHRFHVPTHEVQTLDILLRPRFALVAVEISTSSRMILFCNTFVVFWGQYKSARSFDKPGTPDFVSLLAECFPQGGDAIDHSPELLEVHFLADEAPIHRKPMENHPS